MMKEEIAMTEEITDDNASANLFVVAFKLVLMY